jgi:D-alanyl-D-alanine carboxypeptidase
MRSLLAANLEKAATTRTVAAITERSGSEATTDVADAEPKPAPAPVAQVQATPVSSDTWTPPAMRSPPAKVTAALAQASAAMPPAQAKTEPAPLSSGVIQAQAIAAIPGSSEPMKPVRVKTVQVKAGSTKLASAGPSQPSPPVISASPQAQPAPAETSNAVVAKATEVGKPEPVKPEAVRAEAARPDLPPQPPGHGTGNGLLGVLPASSIIAASPAAQPVAVAAPQAVVAVATAQPASPPSPQISQQTAPGKPVVHTGWIVQVGALESEDEAQQRIEAAKSSARGLLSKADSFTEPIISKDNRKLFRARFAGLERDQAEAVCRALRHSDIVCITVRN